jgi:hypothetical protein
MEPEKLSRIAISNSAGAFLFCVLFPIPILGILFALVSITTGSMAARLGNRASFVAIGLSILWLMILVLIL